jgi:hypothetical protein
MPTTSDPAQSGKLKVFLSYSRKDSAFAEELKSALELLGFDAYLDKEDIAPGEPWEERLGSLIRAADTVVFVISPNSLASRHCTWEVEETVRVAKRIVPVMLHKVEDGTVPDRLRRLNYVFFTEGTSFSKGLGNLAQALRADSGWIREHTRLGELAQRWNERSKPEALLLRGSDLADARRWMAERPNEAPEVSAAQEAFIEQSVAAEARELEGKKRLRWRVQAGLAAASVLLAGLAAVSTMQWRSAEAAKASLAESKALTEKANAGLAEANGKLEQSIGELARSNAGLEQAKVKLERKLSLRVAPYGNEPYDVGPSWYLAATDYAGAVAFVVPKVEPTAIKASGVVIDASRLDPRWAARPVLVTARYIIAGTGGLGTPVGARVVPRIVVGAAGLLTPDTAKILFLGPKGERQLVDLGEVLWESDTLGVSVSSIKGELPFGATQIVSIAESADVLGELTEMPRPAGDADAAAGSDPARESIAMDMAIEGAVRWAARGLKPVVTVGNKQGRNEMTLSIGHFMGLLRYPAELPAGSLAPDLVYTKSTLPGSAGAPIFDAESGALLGIHLLASPRCPTETTVLDEAYGQCSAFGTSMPRLLAAIRSEPDGR